MAWYKDPQLYICRETPGLKLYRMKEPIGTPIALSGIIDYGFLDYSKHLSLANNKESDFDAFLSSIKFDGVTFKLINCQGWVVYQMVSNYHHFTWAREPLNSPFYRLPGINSPETVLLAQKEALDRRVFILETEISPLKIVLRKSKEDRNTLINEKQALDRIISELKARNSTLEDDKIKLINDLNGIKAENLVEKRLSDLEAMVSTLEAEVRRNNSDKNTLIGEKQDLESQVSELTSKLKECCGSADKEPLKSGNNPNWVAFEDLDVLNIPRNTSLKITKAPGALKLDEDDTTNVRASRFHGGIYLVAVNVEELIPGKDEARFDPTFWGQYKNAGTSYAARKAI
ncbi:hypothetical protein MKX01_003132 [Papaver californicum]|nr:hypothetical protein MKX01_003132 [Papaver californicum]